MQESEVSEKCVTIGLLRGHASIWKRSDAKENASRWYLPVRAQPRKGLGIVFVSVPERCVEGGWFHPDRHPDLKALAERIENAA